jgi:aspartate kinase
MALVVQKYGGTSVGSVEKIQNVARRVARTYDEGNDMVVVVSAMAGETNKLVALAEEMCEFPSEREYDVLVAAGEQVSISLLSMALQSMGYKAKSYLGWQVPIYTDSSSTKARIEEIQDTNMREDLHNGTIVIVAGFQGIDRDNNITTLGRGGSDTSAVAVAAALKADVCEILTDVDGVYTTDPRIVPEATKMEKVSYDEMLEMASLGSKILQIRSVEFAKKYDVVVHVRSSLNGNQGTLVMKEDADMETVLVSGVTSPLSAANITVDMIIQNVSHEGSTDLTFTVPRSDFKKALRIVEDTAVKVGAAGVQSNENIAKVSIVGVGMRSHSGIASQMFETLSTEGVNIQMISTSEKYTELAVRVLHAAFGLDKGQVSEE